MRSYVIVPLWLLLN